MTSKYVIQHTVVLVWAFPIINFEKGDGGNRSGLLLTQWQLGQLKVMSKTVVEVCERPEVATKKKQKNRLGSTEKRTFTSSAT